MELFWCKSEEKKDIIQRKVTDAQSICNISEQILCCDYKMWIKDLTDTCAQRCAQWKQNFWRELSSRSLKLNIKSIFCQSCLHIVSIELSWAQKGSRARAIELNSMFLTWAFDDLKLSQHFYSKFFQNWEPQQYLAISVFGWSLMFF